MGNIIESDPTVLAGVRVTTDKRGFDNAVALVVATVSALPAVSTRYIGALAVVVSPLGLYVAVPTSDEMQAGTWLKLTA